jgi:lysophospholipase L1-like esterase
MNFKKIFINFSLIILPLLILEIFSSIIIFQKEKKTGVLFSIFNYKKNSQVNYKINWDKSNNKIVPGKYKSKLSDGRVVEYTINSKGFRNKNFNKKKNTDYRIISFGGSTTMGLESPDDLTYPAQLEKKLKNNGYDVEVLNFGFSSKSLNFIRELFFTEAIQYKPDFITIYSARNSIMYDSIGTKIKMKEIQFPKLQKVNLYLINNIMSFRLLFKIYKKILSSNISTEKIISPYDEKTEHNIYYFTNQYFDTIKQIVDYAEKFDIEIILIKQAVYIDPKIQNIIQNRPLNKLIKNLQSLRRNGLFEMNYEDIFWILTITILNKQIDKFEKYNNVTIVDPISSLISNQKNFEGYLHLTINGNNVLAESIYEKIKNKF